MSKRLYLIRHAEVDASYRGRYLGSTDISLSEAGIQQSQELGARLGARLAHAMIWVSPMLRCQQTWDSLGLATPAMTIGDLREVDFGNWEGKSFSEIHAADPALVQRWGKFDPLFAFPGGESLGGFVERMKRVQKLVLESSSPEIALVAHGGVLTTLICLFLGLDASHYLIFKLARPSLSEMTIFENGKGVLDSLNEENFRISNRGVGEWPG